MHLKTWIQLLVTHGLTGDQVLKPIIQASWVEVTGQVIGPHPSQRIELYSLVLHKRFHPYFNKTTGQTVSDTLNEHLLGLKCSPINLK